MKKRETTKVLKRAASLGVEARRHQFGNKFEWCVEFAYGDPNLPSRTIYTRQQADEFFKRWQRGELSLEFQQLTRRGWALVNVARGLLNLDQVKAEDWYQ